MRPSGNPGDQRVFRHYAQMGADGSVLAVVEVQDTPPAAFVDPLNPKPAPVENVSYLRVDVTDLYPFDFTGVRVRPADVAIRDIVRIKADLKTMDKGPVIKPRLDAKVDER